MQCTPLHSLEPTSLMGFGPIQRGLIALISRLCFSGKAVADPRRIPSCTHLPYASFSSGSYSFSIVWLKLDVRDYLLDRRACRSWEMSSICRRAMSGSRTKNGVTIMARILSFSKTCVTKHGIEYAQALIYSMSVFSVHRSS